MKDFYEGETANMIALEMTKNGGLILDDLKNIDQFAEPVKVNTEVKKLSQWVLPHQVDCI